MKEIDIIVLHYGNVATTKKCIEGIETFCKTYRNIYIINNDKRIDIYKHFKKNKKRILVNSEENIGFARGVNVGVKLALKNKVKYIVLLNNDTTITNDFIKPLFETMENDLHSGAASPVIQGNNKNKTYFYHGGSINHFTGDSDNDDAVAIKNESTIPVSVLSGCCMMLRGTVLKQTGLFDEQFFMYYEDVDMSLRITKAGYKLLVVPTAMISHIGSAAAGVGSPQTLFYLIRSHLLFCRKYSQFPLRYFSLFYQTITFLVKNPNYFSVIRKALRIGA